MKKIIPLIFLMLVALLACEKDTPNPPASVDSMQFEGAPTTVDEGADISLSQYLIITPEAVGDTVTVEWSSSDKEIATVSASGSVEALRAGDVTITAKAMDKTAQVKLTIDKVKIKEFTIPATLEVYVGEKIKFPINDLKPKNAPLYRFEWEADNDGKEPTYSEGKWYLKADKEREYTLTVSVDDAEEAKCVVKFIKPLVEKLVFNPASYTIEEGGSLSLESNLQITPAKDIDANTIKVIWSSSKESVATIDQNGKVQSVAAGKTTITAKAGNKTATCTIEVTAKPAPEDPEDPEDPEKPEDPDTPMDPSDPEIPVDPEKPTFTITFNANGGEGTMESIIVNEGESVTIPECAFTLLSSNFVSWNTSSDGTGKDYKIGDTFTPKEDLTLYAKWLRFYTISFDANGGEGTPIESITINEGESITLPQNPFTREAADFLYWTITNDKNGKQYASGDTFTPTEDVTIYAQWLRYFTIKYDANGGEGTPIESITIKEGESITLPQNPFTRNGYRFKGWLVSILTVKAPGDKYKPTSNITIKASWVFFSGNADGHEWVDLGLPSGTKWASMNVGATTLEGYGDYFAWGETATKSTYDAETYKYMDENGKLTKYCSYSNQGKVDNKKVLDLSDDAAYVNWGTSWRTPTIAQITELADSDNCKWEWKTQNGVDGYLVTSKTNGNYIFLPAAGYAERGIKSSVGDYGYYWAADCKDGKTYNGANITLPYEFSFYYASRFYESGSSHYEGKTIRAVLAE